jgi:hypothetical protein
MALAVIILLSSSASMMWTSASASASKIHCRSFVLPKYPSHFHEKHVLNLRGGNTDDVIPTDFGVLPEDLFARKFDSTNVNLEETRKLAVDESNALQQEMKIGQPASESVESLVDVCSESPTIVAPLSNEGILSLIVSSLTGVKTSLTNIIKAYPALSCMFAVIAAIVAISVSISTIDGEPDQVHVTSNSTPENTSSKRNSEIVLSILIGGIGLAAGSFATFNENPEREVTADLTTARRRRGKSLSTGSLQNVEEGGGEEEIQLTNRSSRMPDINAKNVGACLTATWLGSGMAGRATVIRNVLRLLF